MRVRIFPKFVVIKNDFSQQNLHVRQSSTHFQTTCRTCSNYFDPNFSLQLIVTCFNMQGKLCMVHHLLRMQSLMKWRMITFCQNKHVLNYGNNYHLTSFFGYHFDVIMSCLFKLRRLNSLRRLRHVFGMGWTSKTQKYNCKIQL